MIDLNKIQSDVESVLIYSQCYPFDLNAKELIDKWYNAKKDFIQAFDGNTFIRSKDIIKIELEPEEKEHKFNNFLLALDSENLLTKEFKDFLIDNSPNFFNNYTLNPYLKYNIKSGTKLSKTFKNFIKNPEDVRFAQDVASKFIQQNKIEGYLYLSVDPLDFLSLSENNENWRSCHSLDGEYRAGNLSYMVDQTTCVAFLADDKLQKLDNFPQDISWNSKKWRMLVHTNKNNCIWYNRQYPYNSNELLNKTQKLIFEQFKIYSCMETYKGFKPNSEININYITFKGRPRVFCIGDVLNLKDYLGYCDLIYSSTFIPKVSIKTVNAAFYLIENANMKKSMDQELKDLQEIVSLKIGDKVPCPCCGKNFLTKEDKFLCNNCIEHYDAKDDFYSMCFDCGHKIYNKKLKYKGHYFCKNCYNSLKRIYGGELDG